MPFDARRAERTRLTLLAWFEANARELPWRTRRDPWRVWVSEVMLQQTRVEAVVEPYLRFVRAFPTIASLARANEADVVALWSGLGYYRRARLLHAGARHVVRSHGGKLPRNRAELERIPGIGGYTAGAILSIAFGEREAALDANVSRVVARLGAISEPRSAEGRREIARVAGLLVDSDAPGAVNEALMDLGSAVCTARVARCGICPVARGCTAGAEGSAQAILAPRARKTPRRIALACAVVRGGERVLFFRRPTDDPLLAGLWELPTIEVGEGGTPAAALRDLVRRRSGLEARLDGPLFRVRHDIVGRRIEASVYVASTRAPRPARRDARMLSAEELKGVGVSSLPVKILKALSSHAPARSS